MIRAALLVGVAALVAVSAAHAQQTPGWYVGLEGGWNGVTGASSSFSTGGSTTSFTAHSSSGFAGGLTLGYEWPFNVRLEGEATLRRNDYSNLTTPTTAGTLPLSGNTVSMALMGNVLYDFLPHTAWTPYLGFGIGGAAFTVNSLSAPALGIPSTSATLWQFAYQGIAGVKYALSPTVSINLDYRYFTMPNATFMTGAVTQLKSQYGANTVMLGIAYHGVPPKSP
ncbi:MAG TPA: outer membrane beta-barrel protein [Stellaceae bacterium]|nr:outer membrane beta-barrel protein [Stellaceae bacterium]